jgi:hypothetical protein
MRKTFDFNSYDKPELEITLKDEACTKVVMYAPTLALIEKLQSASSEIKDVVKEGNADAINAMYDLTAELVNCNLSGITVTGEELRVKYKMEFVDVIVFFSLYLDFVDEIKAAKN